MIFLFLSTVSNKATSQNKQLLTNESVLKSILYIFVCVMKYNQCVEISLMWHDYIIDHCDCYLQQLYTTWQKFLLHDKMKQWLVNHYIYSTPRRQPRGPKENQFSIHLRTANICMSIAQMLVFWKMYTAYSLGYLRKYIMYVLCTYIMCIITYHISKKQPQLQ